MTIVDGCMVYVMHVYLSSLHVSQSVETSESEQGRVFVEYKKKPAVDGKRSQMRFGLFLFPLHV